MCDQDFCSEQNLRRKYSKGKAYSFMMLFFRKDPLTPQ